MKAGDKVYCIDFEYNFRVGKEKTVTRTTEYFFYCEEDNDRHPKREYIIGKEKYVEKEISYWKDKINNWERMIESAENRVSVLEKELSE